MKKILLLVLIIGILASIDSDKIFSFFDPNKQEILALVNGEKITYADVESLYDMRYAHTSISPPSVIQLQLEYAELLYKRIEQILITQELQKRKLSVSDERVDAFEAIVRKDYEGTAEYEDTTFVQIVEDSGVSYPFWKSQLKVRLEIETLQKDITKNTLLDSAEILQYVKDHPELANIPDKFDFIVIKSNDKTKLEKIKNKKVYNAKEIEKMGLKAERGLFHLANVPKMYLKDLKQMKRHTFSEIRSANKVFYILYLNMHEKNQDSDGLRLYSMAEKEILETKIPLAYNEWLLGTLETAKITIEEDFLPRNLPSKDLSRGIQAILQESSGLTQNEHVYDNSMPEIPTN